MICSNHSLTHTHTAYIQYIAIQCVHVLHTLPCTQQPHLSGLLFIHPEGDGGRGERRVWRNDERERRTRATEEKENERKMR